MSSEFVRDLAGLDFQTDDDTLPVSSVVKTLDEQIRQLEAAPRDKAAVFSIGDDEDEEEDEEEEEEEEGAGGFSMPAVGLLSELKVSTTSGAGQFFATPVFDGKEQPASSTTESSLSSVALSSPPVDTAQELAALSPVLVPDPAVAAPPQYSHTHQPSVERRAALEAAILAITQDNFPDTDALRAHLFELGRVPPELRLPVLSLLLTGSVSLDHEACTFQPTREPLQLTNLPSNPTQIYTYTLRKQPPFPTPGTCSPSPPPTPCRATATTPSRPTAWAAAGTARPRRRPRRCC